MELKKMKNDHKFDYNLYLIGLSGTGKTTCGRILSEKLNFIFIDLDKEISKNENTSITEIFLKKGEKYFRKIESSLLEKFSKKKNHIISTGGGIIENNSNMRIMKNSGKIIWLTASPKEISKRLSSKYAEKRPLLGDSPNIQTISQMLEKREFLYNQAEFKINTDNNSPTQVVKNLSKLLLRK
ncbi:MAG: shikimate kinase [Chloroflexi bacterium]|nr:shikimate kinase [Chloroflexota bacterium]